MGFSQLFLQRHDSLYEFWLGGVWETVSEALMRQRPHPRVNSIAWNLWHLTRVEDAGLNRFVVDRAQVLDDGPWMQRMNIPWRHHGNGMNFAEVDELNLRIDLAALHDYSQAVRVRTREIVTQIGSVNLDDVMDAERLRVILVNEGLAHSQPEGFLKAYLGLTKGQALMVFGLTHPYHHIGEIDVIASMLGVEF